MPEEGSWLCKAGPGSVWFGVIWCGLEGIGEDRIPPGLLSLDSHPEVPCTFRAVAM